LTAGTDWTSAVAILVSGLILGSMFVYFFARRKTQAAPATDLELRDLEAKRDALVQQLREMDGVGAEERTRLELETAHVLRAIDEHKRRELVVATAQREQPAGDTRRAAIIGFAWGAGSMAALALLAYFVMQAVEPRQQPQTTTQPQQPTVDPAVRQIEQAVEKNPEDLNLRLQLAQAYLERENLMGVFEQTQYVLSKSPKNSRALTYQAIVRMSMGSTAEAVDMLQRATKSDPDLLDAWVALAWVRIQEGKFSEAEAAMQEAMRRHPEEKPRLEQVLNQMKAHQQMPAADANAFRVTIDLDPSARSRATGGVLYVIARAEGVTTGPPVAVKRVSAAAFPTTVELTPADSMMGQPLPPRIRLEARLDSDGDAATRNPNDPFAAQDSVAKGSTVKLALK
jgi:cytochrome c-type biogenesis protein CcmH